MAPVALVNLRLAGDAEPRTTVIRELQYDPVDTLITSLQAVRMDEEITVEVPIHVVGEAAGVKEQSGVLALLMRSVEVSCLPALIPERIDVDVSSLHIHDVATVANLQLPEGVRVTTPGSQPVATVAPPMAEEVVAAVAAPVAEPEVVTERKPRRGRAKGKEEAKGRSKASGSPAAGCHRWPRMVSSPRYR
jgi:large subunit ribosomal protein L25